VTGVFQDVCLNDKGQIGHANKQGRSPASLLFLYIRGLWWQYKLPSGGFYFAL